MMGVLTLIKLLYSGGGHCRFNHCITFQVLRFHIASERQFEEYSVGELAGHDLPNRRQKLSSSLSAIQKPPDSFGKF